MTEVWLWVEQLAPIVAVRSSSILYPAVLTAHIIGLALTFGATMITAVRLLLATPPGASSLRLSAQLSLLGFALAAGTGLVLFAVDASDYATNTALQVKLALIALAAGNAWAYSRAARAAGGAASTPLWFRRLVGVTAIALWTGVIIAGRWIAF